MLNQFNKHSSFTVQPLGLTILMVWTLNGLYKIVSHQLTHLLYLWSTSVCNQTDPRIAPFLTSSFAHWFTL